MDVKKLIHIQYSRSDEKKSYQNIQLFIEKINKKKPSQ